MQWKNKGHEIDKYAERICALFETQRQIILFGAGKTGTQFYKTLLRYGIFAGFADNDIDKQNNGFEGQTVYSPNVLKDMEAMIVVSVGKEYSNEVKHQLENMGMTEGINFITAEEFEKKWFPVLSLYYFGRLYTNLAQICVTERCTLRCKKCAHACHLVDIHSKDISIEHAKHSADSFFRAFDFIGEFVLIGGEPFLYKELGTLIEYIGEKYRDKIELFSITTNGTIVPADDLLAICKKHGVTVRITDYKKSIPRLEKNYKRLYETLKIHGINSIVWETDHETSWFDYGFDENLTKNATDTQRTFDECKTPCREVSGGKYYYCVMAHTVANNMKLKIGETDYFDLDSDFEKQELLEFELGYSEKGYLDMCSRCRGKEAENYRIPAAEQVRI